MSDTVFLDRPAFGGNRNPFNYEKIEEIDRDSVTPWLTLDEITQHLNLFQDESQDDFLKDLEVATRQAIEDYLGMSILPMSYRVYYSMEAMAAYPVALDLPEISQNLYPSQDGVIVDAVGYFNSSNAKVVLSSSSYFFDQSGNRIVVSSLPTDISTGIANPIFAEYTTSSNPIAAYPVIKQAAKLLLTHLYNNRSATSDRIVRNIPFSIDALLRKYKPLVM